MKNMYEIFTEFEKAMTDDERVKVLRKNDCFALRQTLRAALDPTIEFAIKKVPLYKPSDSPAGMAYMNMTSALRQLYLFQKEHPKLIPDLSDARREQLLIQILESLESKEAVVYMNIILKKLRVKGLSFEFVTNLYPEAFESDH